MHLRRTNIHLIADMLCLGEVGVTEIMYGANMSYHQVRQYLDFLVAGRFLESTGMRNRGIKYRVTEEGDRLRQSIERVLGLLELPDVA